MNMRTLTSVAMLATIAYGCSPSTETQKEVAYTASNPFLPLWEYIPDAEPYIFEDPDRPGEMRVYIYGSHDALRTAYCGREQVVW